jgi:hypothetical protein
MDDHRGDHGILVKLQTWLETSFLDESVQR